MIPPGIAAHILDAQNSLSAEEGKKILKVIEVNGDFLGHGDSSLDGARRAFEFPAGDRAALVELEVAFTENLVAAHLVICGRVLLVLADLGFFCSH